MENAEIRARLLTGSAGTVDVVGTTKELLVLTGAVIDSVYGTFRKGLPESIAKDLLRAAFEAGIKMHEAKMGKAVITVNAEELKKQLREEGKK